MCSPETIQSFVVLSTFAKAGGSIHGSEIEDAVGSLASESDIGSFNQLGPLSVASVMNELIMGKMADASEDYTWSLTSSGRDLLRVQRGLVFQSAPEIAGI